MRSPARPLATLVALSALWLAASPASPARAANGQASPPAASPSPPEPQPQASASASPAASEAPSPQISATPAASPTATATAPALRPIRLGRTRVGIVTGTTVLVDVSGGAGPLALHSTSDGILARFDARTHQLALTGASDGTGSVTISDSFGDEATVDVLVGPAAGVVPADVTVDVGGIVSPQFAEARVRAAIAAAARMQPGTTLDVHGLSFPQALQPGDLFEAVARVRVAASDTFVEATGTTNVHVRDETLDELVPVRVLYSDDPEKLQQDDDGVLYRASIDTTTSARLYLYHVSEIANRRLYLALQSSAAAARVQVLGYGAGPSNAYGYVGHVSTLHYLLAHATQESAIYELGGDAPVVLPIGHGALQPLDLIDGIFDLRVLEGAPVNVTVIAVSGDADPLDLLSGPELPGDGHGRRGEYSLSDVAPLALSLAAGSPDPAPFTVGVPGLPNLRAGGRPLLGDYGVLRPVMLQLSNPTSDPRTLYFYEQAEGGAASTTIWFEGDPKPAEIPCVRFPNRYTVRSFDLAPNQSLMVDGTYMTDGASSFPLLFGLTSTPPSPPPGPYSADACAPKPLPTPAASPVQSPPAPSPAPDSSASTVPSAVPSPSPS